MNTTITENDENVREVNVDELLKNVLSFESRTSPKSAFEMGDIYDLPIKKKNAANIFSQKPARKTPAKIFGTLPNFTKKRRGGARQRKHKKKTRKNSRR